MSFLILFWSSRNQCIWCCKFICWTLFSVTVLAPAACRYFSHAFIKSLQYWNSKSPSSSSYWISEFSMNSEIPSIRSSMIMHLRRCNTPFLLIQNLLIFLKSSIFPGCIWISSYWLMQCLISFDIVGLNYFSLPNPFSFHFEGNQWDFRFSVFLIFSLFFSSSVLLLNS